ncbi:alpha/beta fold hydrolase [Cumulibacter manganitolerans]|uniref:alpha/beta fold hydrolase n=1 Tax=Cumulibacter manganitolerans TaxID=1884992 RepID=UPI001E5CE7B9|nr:alpha/beta hydrolase [Cumulibacter manganitolerans]
MVQTIEANGLELAFDERGDAGAPPLLLVAGLGMQLTGWRDGFCDALASRGLRVIRYDNRDSGLSTHLDDAPAPDLSAVRGGDLSSVTYTLRDLAADAAGLLDALGIDQAHVVGMSMGGMIVQQLALDFPQRVASLTSIMSTTGDRAVGAATAEATAALMTPVPLDRAQAIDKLTADSRVIGSPGFAFDEEAVRARHAAAFDRAVYPVGTARQFAAIAVSPDRTPALRGLSVPALVIHGADDPLIAVSGGEATAAAIPGSRFVAYDGMGHDLPEELWEQIADEIAQLALGAVPR